MTPSPGTLIIPQRAFKATFQAEQMFYSNLEKKSQDVENHQHSETAFPRGDCGRLVVGQLLSASQSRAVVNSTQNEEPAFTQVPDGLHPWILLH